MDWCKGRFRPRIYLKNGSAKFVVFPRFKWLATGHNWFNPLIHVKDGEKEGEWLYKSSPLTGEWGYWWEKDVCCEPAKVLEKFSATFNKCALRLFDSHCLLLLFWCKVKIVGENFKKFLEKLVSKTNLMLVDVKFWPNKCKKLNLLINVLKIWGLQANCWKII